LYNIKFAISDTVLNDLVRRVLDEVSELDEFPPDDPHGETGCTGFYSL